MEPHPHRLPLPRPCVGLCAAVLLAAPANAQSHARSELIHGQIARFDVTGAPPASLALFLISVTGQGPGLCLPPPFGFCLDLLDPLTVLAVTVADAGGVAATSFVLPRDLPLVPVWSQAIVIAFNGQQVTTGRTNVASGSIQPINALGDTFDGPSLAPAWGIHNPQMLSWSLANGELVMRPTQAGPAATWYADGEGPLVWKEVTGDFTATATVVADDAQSAITPPAPDYRLGGITVRDPRAAPGHHNWLHVTIGGGTAAAPIAVEDKTTVESTSDLLLHPVAAARAEIRVQRRGAVFAFFHRANGAAAWQALRSHARPDLPPTLQVGLNVSSWVAPPAVRLRVDALRFDP